MELTRKKTLYRLCAALFVLALPIALLAAPGGASASTAKTAATSENR